MGTGFTVKCLDVSRVFSLIRFCWNWYTIFIFCSTDVTKLIMKIIQMVYCRSGSKL